MASKYLSFSTFSWCILLLTPYAHTFEDEICITQKPGTCLGVYECGNENIGEMECAFYAFDNNCTSFKTDDAPYERPKPGDKISFEGLNNSIVIKNVIAALKPNKISVVFAYGDDEYGEGVSENFKGNCSSEGSQCAFVRAGFPC
jgi:hypothetical protein